MTASASDRNQESNPPASWSTRLRALARFFLYFFNEVRRDRLNLRAAALTYSVVLSLVPMLALSTAILKGMGAGDQMRNAAYRLIDNLAGQARALPQAAAAGTPPASAAGGTQNPAAVAGRGNPTAETAAPAPAEPDAKNFTDHLYDAVDQVFAYVDRTNFAALGAIGTFLLLITVLIVINGIEEAMNAIWQVEKSRSLGRKIMNYMALLLICPLTINLGIGATTMLHTPAIARRLNSLIPLMWMQNLIFKLFPFFLLTMTFALLYLFLPNTRVRARAAWIGGATGALALIILQKVFILLQLGVANYNAIYGSFATVPLFLLWLNSAWLVFLIGAEVAFTSQFYQRQAPGATTKGGKLMEMSLAFDLMRQVYINFERRQESSAELLSRQCQADTARIEPVLARLTAAGVLHRAENQISYLPATPAANLETAEISRIFFKPEKSDGFGPGLSRSFCDAGSRALPAHPWLEEAPESPATDTTGFSR